MRYIAIVEQPNISPAMQWCKTTADAEQWLIQHRRNNAVGFGTRYIIAECVWNIIE